MNRRDFLNYTMMATPALALGMLPKKALASALFTQSLTTCGRSPAIFRAIEKLKGLKCDATTPEDLLTIEDMVLHHIHLPSFQENDFEGLTSLKKLEFFSLFHKPNLHPEAKAFSGKVFAPMTALEHLIITDDLGQLDDDAFSSLGTLKILDLQYTTLIGIPQSLLELQQLEELIADEGTLEPGDFQKLRDAFGDRLKQA